MERIPTALRNEKGITLIELIIAIGIGVAVIASSYGLLNYGFRSYAENAARIQAQQAIRNVSLYMSRDLHRADPGDVSVTVTADGYDQLTVGSTTYELDGDNNQVLMDSHPIASNITGLDISLSGSVVEYTITGVYQNRNRQEETITVSSKVTIR